MPEWFEEEEGELHGVQRQVGYEGLMERLIVKLGLNLTSCRKNLGLHHKTIERMMSHCAACGESSDCREKLGKARRMDAPPAYCYNRKMLLALKERSGDSSKPADRPTKGTSALKSRRKF
jgi:hypothetical protein